MKWVSTIPSEGEGNSAIWRLLLSRVIDGLAKSQDARLAEESRPWMPWSRAREDTGAMSSPPCELQSIDSQDLAPHGGLSWQNRRKSQSSPAPHAGSARD